MARNGLLSSLMASLVICSPAFGARAAQEAASMSAKQIVQTVVNKELAADKNDNSHWMYEDAKKTPVRSTLKLVVETPKGDLSKTLKINGQQLSPDQRSQDEQHIQALVSDPAEQQKQARDRHEDAEKARAMLKMLPNAFIWKEAGRENGEIRLTFTPDPNFDPPTRDARVFAAMAGTMLVDEAQMRLKSLKGQLTQDVDFGWGILGRLYKGGTFDIERREIAPKEWQIVATHVHISGHALILKSINENEDEETSNFKLVPSLSLAQARDILEKENLADLNASAASSGASNAPENGHRQSAMKSSARLRPYKAQ